MFCSVNKYTVGLTVKAYCLGSSGYSEKGSETTNWVGISHKSNFMLDLVRRERQD